jgi:hypothetical protein
MLACATAGFAGADPGATPAGELYGAELNLRDPTPLAELIAHPERFSNAQVLLHGELVDVCQRKGCWTILRDGDSQVRVRFKDYAFFVPKDSRGMEAFVEGVATVSVLSQDEARHYESERSGGDPEKIVGPRREVGFEASGVRILSQN